MSNDGVIIFAVLGWTASAALGAWLLYWIIRLGVRAGIRDTQRERAGAPSAAFVTEHKPVRLPATADNPLPNTAAVKDMIREQRASAARSSEDRTQ